MSKNYQPLIPHAPLGGKFSFISYSNYSIIVQAPGCRERRGISGNAAAAGLSWEGLFVALSSCPFHPERQGFCAESPLGEGPSLTGNRADSGWGIPGFPSLGCSTKRPTMTSLCLKTYRFGPSLLNLSGTCRLKVGYPLWSCPEQNSPSPVFSLSLRGTAAVTPS